MKKLLALTLLAVMCANVFAQQVVLVFTGRDATTNTYVQLSRIEITDLTQGWTETLTYPDTMAILTVGTGIEENSTAAVFGLAQNNPNPFNGTTDVNLTITESGPVSMEITDVNGRVVERFQETSLQCGTHQFRINVSDAGIYFLTARQNGKTSSVKMVNNGGGANNAIEYAGTVAVPVQSKNGVKGAINRAFAYGDAMTYKGYSEAYCIEFGSNIQAQTQILSENIVLDFSDVIPSFEYSIQSINTHSAVIAGRAYNYTEGTCGLCWSTHPGATIEEASTVCSLDNESRFETTISNLLPLTTYYIRMYVTNGSCTEYVDEELVFQTGNPNDGQPCTGAATLTDVEGNIYNTVQIGNQCWMKENLRTKKYADNTPIQQGTTTSYDVAYWYYPNNDASNQATYGLLYNWPAAMRNSSSSTSNPSNVQGICPNGWHVPSDAEWTQMTDYVSSQSQYYCTNTSYIAKALAATTGWSSYTGSDANKACFPGYNSASNNATGFSALPAGYYDGSYNFFGNGAHFWSATEYGSSIAYDRGLDFGYAGVDRSNGDKYNGFSVRCVRD